MNKKILFLVAVIAGASVANTSATRVRSAVEEVFVGHAFLAIATSVAFSPVSLVLYGLGKYCHKASGAPKYKINHNPFNRDLHSHGNYPISYEFLKTTTKQQKHLSDMGYRYLTTGSSMSLPIRATAVVALPVIFAMSYANYHHQREDFSLSKDDEMFA